MKGGHVEILLLSKNELLDFEPDKDELVIDLVDGKFSLTTYEKTLHQWARFATKYSIDDVKKRIFKRWLAKAKKVNLDKLIKNINKVYIVTEDGKETAYSKYMKGFLIWFIDNTK